MRLVTLGLLSLTLAGCGPSVGGGATGSMAGAVSGATAPYAVVDLASRTFVYRSEIPDLLTSQAYRNGSLVFRRITVGSRDVLVGVFEVTQAQWQAIAGDSPWTGLPAALAATPAPQMPASNLDYDTTIATLAAFTLQQARLDLPTDEEWSTACGTSTGWSWGVTADLAQLRAAAVVHETADGVVGARTPGTLAANPRGFHDMHGNLWEWTKPGHAIRGGSWRDSHWMSRSEVMPSAGQGLRGEIPHALIGARLVLRP